MCNAIAGDGKRAAHGPASVCSASKVECHGVSQFKFGDLNGVYKVRATDAVHAYWESRGFGFLSCPGDARCGHVSAYGECVFENVPHFADMINDPNGVVLPIRQGEEDCKGFERSDFIEKSHVWARGKRGAACGCNVVPERGDHNGNRGEVNMTGDYLTAAHNVIKGWPLWWSQNIARPIAKKRLGIPA